MTFKPAIWRPIAAVLSVVNLGAVAAEPWHATVHAGLALAFVAWAQRLGRSPAQRAQAEPANRLEDLEAELDQLRGELAEAQERLDFTERVLARESAVRRPDADPPR
jgi:TolA-binding protein